VLYLGRRVIRQKKPTTRATPAWADLGRRAGGGAGWTPAVGEDREGRLLVKLVAGFFGEKYPEGCFYRAESTVLFSFYECGAT
jgi:hypothetical protein